MDSINPATSNPEALNPETPQISQPSKDNHGITIASMAVFVLLSLGAVAFLYYQNQQLKTMLASYQQGPATPVPTATTDPTADWKTYTNTNAQISFKYPVSLTESLTSSVSGPYLGGPDHVVNFADKATVHEGTDAPFDGFSVYEIEITKLGLSFDAYITKEVQSTKGNPMGTGNASAVKTSIGGQDFTYIDAETKIRRYFMLSSDNKRIAIFSRINSTPDFLTTFDQILSTFKFAPLSAPVVPPGIPIGSPPAVPNRPD